LLRFLRFVFAVVLPGTVLHFYTQGVQRPGSSTIGSRILSPTAVVTWLAELRNGGGAQLDLLVIWRGNPGWFLRGNRSGSTTGTGSALTAEETFGDVVLKVRLEPDKRRAWVQNTEVSLRNGENVILVDRVDTPDEVTIVGTRAIDSHIPEVPVRVERMPGITKDLVDFLRCDLRLPDPTISAFVMVACNELTAR
jgi:hypothetical protein